MPAQQALTEARPLTEAATQPGELGRRQRILLINAGWGSSGFYGADVLREAATSKVFPAGTHLYINHPTQTEDAERPERDLRDLAGVLATDAVYDAQEKGLFAVVETFPQYRQILAEMKDHIGLSIRAFGKAEYGEAEGREGAIITALTEAQSVDYVTRPGRGGRIVDLLESARQQSGGLLREAVNARVRRKGSAEVDEERAATVRETAEQIRAYAVALVEAEDRREGEAESSEAKAPPFKAKDDDEPDADSDSDDDEDDEKPPFLKGKVKEARNVGNWLESRIHLAFTEMCDDMFGQGRLTREERISLSNAIGEGLAAFNSVVAEKVPALYARDIWDEPPAPEQPAEVIETAEPDTQTAAPIEAAAPKNEPGSSPADNTDKEGEMPELTEAQARELEEARTVAENDKAQALAEAETAKQAAVDAELKLARFTALEAARPIAAQVLTESGLPAAAQGKILAALTSDSVPLTAENTLDESALKSTVEESAKAEATYLASLAEGDGAGQPRGLGESATAAPSGPDPATVTALEETYKSRGLSPEAARLAAVGRP